MNFLKNYLSTLSFLALMLGLYTYSDFHSNLMSQNISLQMWDIVIFIPHIFYAILIAYIILLLPFYHVHKNPSKARIVLWYFSKVVRWNNTYSEIEKTALLTWMVKIFFIPLMITWFSQHVFSVINNWYNAYNSMSLISSEFLVFFNTHFFWTAFSTILFFDVLFFTIGYLIEMPVLKNTIKSVEPTIVWWLVCIICYPPFNGYVTDLIWWYSTDFPSFGNMYVHLSLNIVLLILMAIYAWASISLGLKASNLTNRGIISKGPYAYIRHPAYICKNTAWFIWAIPMVIISTTNENTSLLSVCIWIFWWAFIYYLRAITEENHLSADPDYRAYKKQVPYKFIPKVW